MRAEPTALNWVSLGEAVRDGGGTGGVVQSFVAAETLRVGDDAWLSPANLVGKGSIPGSRRIGRVVGGKRSGFVCSDSSEDVGAIVALADELAIVAVFGFVYDDNGDREFVQPGSEAVSLPAGVPVPSLSSFLDNLGNRFNVKNFLATGLGVDDDTSFIQDAIDACIAAGGGTVYFPQGTYKITSSLIVALDGNVMYVPGQQPKHVVLEGDGLPLIVPTAGVTEALVVYDATGAGVHKASIRGLRFDGSATTGATGIRLGGTSIPTLTGYIDVEDVEAQFFDGVNIAIRSAVGVRLRKVNGSRGGKGISIGLQSADLPTVVDIGFCQFRENTTKGIELLHGYQIHVADSVIESNFEEGLYCVPVAGGVIEALVVEDTWFENNGRDNPLTFFDARVDGSAVGSDKLTCSFLRVHIPSAAGKSLYLKSADFVLDSPKVIFDASIEISTGCSGVITGWHQSAHAMSAAIANSSGVAIKVSGALQPNGDLVVGNNVFKVDTVTGDVDVTGVLNLPASGQVAVSDDFTVVVGGGNRMKVDELAASKSEANVQLGIGGGIGVTRVKLGASGSGAVGGTSRALYVDFGS